MYKLDNDAKNEIMKTLDSIIFGKVKNHIASTKQLWDKLIKLSIVNEQIRKNKLNIVVQKFDSFEVLSGETIDKWKPILLIF